jgi:hypothetical protein
MSRLRNHCKWYRDTVEGKRHEGEVMAVGAAWLEDRKSNVTAQDNAYHRDPGPYQS